MKHHASSFSREELERRRSKAAMLFKKGISHAEISRRLGVTSAAVAQWRKAYAHGGRRSLASKGHPGFSSKATPEKRARFKAEILKGPLAHGYPTNLWTLSRLATVLSKIVRVRYSEVWTWKIVRDLGFTPQKPAVKAEQRNEKAIANWRLVELPRLKKMGA